ncbi:MAG TPA: hypothetical protein VK213_04280 [Bacteroidales bacterium]|nr:hypothetical protein [Bacteroidales bacterium]
MTGSFRQEIFNINTTLQFEDAALKIMKHQYENNPVYRSFTDLIKIDPGSVTDIHQIPFLPVEFFRNHNIITGGRKIEITFESSGTAGMVPGRHHVSDVSLYEESFIRGFSMFYGAPEEYILTALLPSYLERSGSSLVYMVDKLINLTKSELSGFYRDDKPELISTLKKGLLSGKKLLLIGVSFALLDLADQYPADLSGVTIMETGGMKGRRKEVTRDELHNILKSRLNVDAIHSEYGMTELLSQAYSKHDGIFHCPPWMKILLRDPQDPLSVISEPGRTGGINIIDLANVNSCSFISTGDLGRLHKDGGFEVLGRFDNSDIRGCNLLSD